MVPGRGAFGVSPSPLAGPGWIRPLGARSNRDPGAPPGGALGHPAGPIAKELPGVAQPRRSARPLPQRRPLSGTQSSCSPAPRTWAPAPGLSHALRASGSLAPERVPRAPPPGSPVPVSPKVRIRLCAARGNKNRTAA
ncbi:hypothetical protein NN561_000310 [Cricetulus griseus]